MRGHPGVELGFFGEVGFQPGARQAGVGGDQIELGAVAGGNHQRFRAAGHGDEFVGGCAEFFGAHGEAFAHFDGRRSVIEAKAQKFHQTNAKTPSERMNQPTVNSDSRRPVSPRTDLTANNTT